MTPDERAAALAMIERLSQLGHTMSQAVEVIAKVLTLADTTLQDARAFFAGTTPKPPPGA